MSWAVEAEKNALLAPTPDRKNKLLFGRPAAVDDCSGGGCAFGTLVGVPDLPDGIVTFLFTDIEGSTALWEEAPDTMMQSLELHDQLIDKAATAHRGVLVRPRGEGDSRFVVFANAIDALQAAVSMQRSLTGADWMTPRPLLVRIAVHTGASNQEDGDYYGSAVNRAARLRAVAHGGQTLISRATCELVRDHTPRDVSLRDLGEHGLRDLTRPEHIFQVDIDGLDSSFPPIRSLSAVPNNLPVQLTEFVGREDELAEAKRITMRSRLMTILAPGGAGKTRLAIQAAADLATSFPDGAYFVNLAPIVSPDDIAQTAAESIGVSLAGDEDMKAQLLAHLANERLLIVFDNFEHVAKGAPIVSAILEAAPEVTVIATSRTKLNIAGEAVLNLSGLETDADGIRLFTDAATRADSGFELATGDQRWLDAILELVEGMPLGILLAAAWVDTLRIDEIASEIERSLDFLAAEGVDDQRHRSIRAVFDYSWSLLGEEERQIFAALSIFRGGFTREAASQVTGASPQNLSNLVSKSLIVRDRDASRYHVHELLRQYAAEELEGDSERLDAITGAHISFYSDLSDQAEALLIKGNEVEFLRRIGDDIDNIRWAWRQVLERVDPKAARSLLVGLEFLYEVRGWLKAGDELFGAARHVFAPQTDDASAVAWAIITSSKAKCMTNLGQAAAALPLAKDAVECLRPLRDPFALILALEVVAETATQLDEVDGVSSAAVEAIEVADRAGLEMWAAGLKTYLVFAHIQAGRIEPAMKLLHEADVVLSRMGEQFLRTWNIAGQAMIAMMQDRVEDAISLHRQQAELAREVGYIRAEGIALQGLGQAFSAGGDIDAAQNAFVGSLEKFERMGSVPDMAGLLLMIARMKANQGQIEQAVEILACVVEDPIREQLLVFEQTRIGDTATAALEQLESELEAEVFKRASARGAAKVLDVQVKELLPT